MTTCGKILDLTEEMWLDKMSMIMIIGFEKLAERHRIQCNDWNGASFQVHAEVGIVKFKQNREGLHCHQFSPCFIAATQKQGTQPLGTIAENATGHANQQQE